MQTVLNVAFNQSNLVPLNKKNHCRRIKHICFWSIVKNETLRQQRSIQFSHCEFISSNIPTSPVYGVYISQLIRYSRACCSYHDFLDRELLPTKKLLKPGFLVVKLKSWLRKFYVATMTWLPVTEYLCQKITTNMFHLSYALPGRLFVHDLLLGLFLD